MTYFMLCAQAAKLGVALTATQEQLLLQLLDALDEWNQRINLTAIRVREQQITKHLLDSLSIHPLLRGQRIIDVGTGAGFPGLPLALVNPDKHFTLLDATAKKLRFVSFAAQLLGLQNVTVVHARAENLKPAQRFDCVLTRAFGSLERIVTWCGPMCLNDGRLLAMKGRLPTEELQSLPSGWKLVAAHPVQIPDLDEQRHLLELCRSHVLERSSKI